MIILTILIIMMMMAMRLMVIISPPRLLFWKAECMHRTYWAVLSINSLLFPCNAFAAAAAKVLKTSFGSNKQQHTAATVSAFSISWIESNLLDQLDWECSHQVTSCKFLSEQQIVNFNSSKVAILDKDINFHVITTQQFSTNKKCPENSKYFLSQTKVLKSTMTRSGCQTFRSLGRPWRESSSTSPSPASLSSRFDTTEYEKVNL